MTPLMRSPINHTFVRLGISFLALFAVKYTSMVGEHGRPGLVINVISRGSVLSQDAKGEGNGGVQREKRGKTSRVIRR